MRFVMFVHTSVLVGGIIMSVNPNTLYSFCYTPSNKNTFSGKRPRSDARAFFSPAHIARETRCVRVFIQTSYLVILVDNYIEKQYT